MVDFFSSGQPRLKDRSVHAQLERARKERLEKILKRDLKRKQSQLAIEEKLSIRTKSVNEEAYEKDLEKLDKQIEEAEKNNDRELVEQLEGERAATLDERDARAAIGVAQINADIEATKAEIRKLERELEALLNPIYTTADAQALLLFNIDKFATGGPSVNRYYSQILGNPVHSRSHLLSPKNVHGLMNISNDLLSSLIPRVELYKVSANGYERQILFEEYQDSKTITQNREGRGTGAGIKKVTIDKNGTNTANADMQVEIKLSLYFSSLEEVFKDRGGYKYADLITPRPVVSPDGSEDYERNKIKIGYAAPTGDLWKHNSSLKSVIASTSRSYYLLYTGHNLDLRENGSVVLDIEYHGYIEKRIQKTDLFELTMTKSEVKKLRSAQKRILDLQKKKPSQNSQGKTESDDKLSRLIESLKQDNVKMRTNAYSSFLRKIFENKKIIRVSFTDADIRGLRLTKVLKPDFVQASIRDRMRKAAEAKKRRETNPEEPEKSGATDRKDGTFEIEYFYLGDLLERIFELIRNDDLLKEIGFTFTEVPYMDYSTGNIKTVQISKIPIAMNSFTSWFHDNVIKKGERTTYNIRDFIMDIMNNLVSGVFRSQDFQSEAKLHGKGVSIPTFSYGTFLTHKPDPHKGMSKRVESFSTSSQATSKYSNYLIYSSNSRLERILGTNNEAQDSKFGIYHLIAGKEKGLTKRIKFTREQQKYYREHMMTSNGITEPGKVFKDLYNANIEMFGNPIFSPGMQVFVSTLSYDYAYAKAMNIVGYYRVLKVSSSIEGPKFQTDLECRWEYIKD